MEITLTSRLSTKGKIISVIFPFVLVLSLFLGLLQAEAIIIDRIIAIVNKDVITLSDLQIKKYLLVSQSKNEFIELNDLEQQKLLEELIEQTLQVQEAKKFGLKISTEQIEDTINNIKANYNIISDERLEEELNKQKMTLADLKRQIEQNLLVKKVIGQEIESKILITDENITDYYVKHKDNYSHLEEYHIAHITLTINDPKDEQEIFRIKQKAANILERLKEGMNFKEAAQKYSEGLDALDGGDLGFMKKVELLPEFQLALASMKVNEISHIIYSEKGAHILKLIARRMPDPNFNQALKEEIIRSLRNEMFTAKYSEWLEKLKKQAYIEIKLVE